jgi:hypothetical protein
MITTVAVSAITIIAGLALPWISALLKKFYSH